MTVRPMPTNDFQRSSLLTNLLRVALLGCLIGLAGCGNKGALYLPSAPEAQTASEADAVATPPAQTAEPDAAASPTPDPQ